MMMARERIQAYLGYEICTENVDALGRLPQESYQTVMLMAMSSEGDECSPMWHIADEKLKLKVSKDSGKLDLILAFSIRLR